MREKLLLLPMLLLCSTASAQFGQVIGHGNDNGNICQALGVSAQHFTWLMWGAYYGLTETGASGSNLNGNRMWKYPVAGNPAAYQRALRVGAASNGQVNATYRLWRFSEADANRVGLSCYCGSSNDKWQCLLGFVDATPPPAMYWQTSLKGYN